MSKGWYKTILEEGEVLKTNLVGDTYKSFPDSVEYVTENDSGIVVNLTFKHGEYRRHIAWADIWTGEVKIESAERKYEIKAEGEHAEKWRQFTKLQRN